MTTIRSKSTKPRGCRSARATPSRSFAADLQKQLDRRTRELAKTRKLLKEALQQQTATTDVLKVISRSTFDLQTVLDTLTESATQLADADMGSIARKDERGYYHATAYKFAVDWVRIADPLRLQPGRGSVVGRALLAMKAVQIADVSADPEYDYPDIQKAAGYRTLLGVPMMRQGEPIGVLFLGRRTVEPFTDKQIELVTTFADQAVIAIENARLFDEVQAKTRDLTESLQQQTATSDVLKVISRSAFDLQRVLETLVESAAKLCEADSAFVYQRDGDAFRLAATFGFSAEYEKFMKPQLVKPSRGTLAGRTALEARIIHIPDILVDPEYTWQESQARGGYRTMLGVPMLREGFPIGIFAMTRSAAKPFTNKQIALLQTFTDQAVIAIENIRLFDEVQARTRDLQESLQQQTATAEVLKVISRSTFDLPAVLHALVETAARLCNADKGTITRQREGVFYRAESFGFSEDFMNYVRGVPVVVDRHSATGRALFDGVVVHISDVETDPDYTFREGQRLGDFRALLGVPMLREGIPIGVITMTRTEPEAFTDKQIELAVTFADQAAIAIENVRLFDEVQQRTRELSQSLDDLRKAQDRLVQTEKLASLGQLTAGIAHEIKNPLNFINNFSALSVELTDELKEVLTQETLTDKGRAEVGELTNLLKDNLDKVVQHGRRADSIVKNMLLHSREGSGERRSADINALVGESLNLAYHGARAEKADFSIKLKQNFDLNAGSIELYPQEITRALLNLISNGFYAATRRKGGGDDEKFEPFLSATTRDLGEAVEIRIRDNGTGIPSEVKEKIFNPFFTTKPTGEGTGLGLSMTHEIIVKQHGGRIDVETEPGSFTEFIITLPRGNGTAA